MSGIVLGGPMADRADECWRKSNWSKNGAHYNIYSARKDPEASIVALREWFHDDASVNGMNFILFSTSGVHGCYTTIEEIEASMALYPDGPPMLTGDDDYPDDYTPPEITFLIVQPRIVGMTYGLAKIRNADDVAWVKRMRDLSTKAVAGIGRPATEEE